MKKYIIAFIFLFIFQVTIISQINQSILNQDIVNSFIRNYDRIEKEVLNLRIDNNTLSLKIIKRNLSTKPHYNQSVENLKKYGLGEEPIDSYLTIVYAYSFLVISDEIKIANDDSLKSMYNQSINRYKSVLSLEDISLIEKNRKKLYNKF